MDALLHYRNWLFFIVLPSIGLLSILINFPIIDALVLDTANKSYATSLQHMLATFPGTDKYQFILLVSMSYFIGFFVQGISVISWKMTRTLRKCRVKNCTYISKVGKDGETQRMDPSGRCVVQNVLRKWGKLLSFFIVPCIKGESINPSAPKAGDNKYAEFQFFLEKNREIASYLEWEKFLSSFYEYTFIAILLSMPNYLVYGAGAILRYLRNGGHADGIFISLSLILGFVTIVLWHASMVHRKARECAEAEAWKIACEAKKASRGARGRYYTAVPPSSSTT